jgi:hypothetical protein
MSVKYYEALKEQSLVKVNHKIHYYNALISQLEEQQRSFFATIEGGQRSSSLGALPDKDQKRISSIYKQINHAVDGLAYQLAKLAQKTRYYDALIDIAKKYSNAE